MRLPDPGTHSADDWPAVYSRMERNMERMQIQPPRLATKHDIRCTCRPSRKRPPARD
jgi:hypothetical protein